MLEAAGRVEDHMRPERVAVAWHDSAERALARMRAAGLDALPVVLNDRQVIGLVERGAAQACLDGGNWLDSVPVASLMRRGAFCCRADATLAEALASMDRLEAELLAVLDEGGRLVGTIDRAGAEAEAGTPLPATIIATATTTCCC